MRVAATEDAYHFVTGLSLALAAGGPVLDRSRWFQASGEALHLEWAKWADLLVVAPATADALAGAANGMARDVVGALVLAGVPRVAWAPGMNPEMWRQEAVQRNVARLREAGHEILGPESGAMAAVGEGEGSGRMVEPEEIARFVESLDAARDLEGLHLLVSAGPTREYLDPVRYISNPSSGKMGYAIAAAAARRGARVTLVSGPTNLPEPNGVERLEVESAEEMLAVLRGEFGNSHALVMAAAVADWRPASPSDRKEPKVAGPQSIEFVRTPDILEELASERTHQVMVGFAMETDAGVERAAQKARRKKLDFICLNYPTREGSAFGSDENEVVIVKGDGNTRALPRMQKTQLAGEILDEVKVLLESSARHAPPQPHD